MLTFIALTVFTASARAALLAEYQLQGSGSGASASSDANDATAIPDLSVSALAISQTGLFAEDNNTTLVQDGSDDSYAWFSRASILGADPVTDGHYFEFTLTPTDATLSLDTLTARMGVSKQSFGAVGWSLIVRSSLDGYAADLGTLVRYDETIGRNDPPVWDDLTLDVSSLGVITGPITFRLYARDESVDDASNKYLLLDTVSLTGSVNAVVIPTPAAMSAGLPLLSALMMRRRHRGA
ncbi:hypothetical protein HED60_18095 [Planctomycetales bacterium ZRK34]|nr:hypothetical protein HED60_18095 [Planctomycetales bacterium ZRK34]